MKRGVDCELTEQEVLSFFEEEEDSPPPPKRTHIPSLEESITTCVHLSREAQTLLTPYIAAIDQWFDQGVLVDMKTRMQAKMSEECKWALTLCHGSMIDLKRALGSLDRSDSAEQINKIEPLFVQHGLEAFFRTFLNLCVSENIQEPPLLLTLETVEEQGEDVDAELVVAIQQVVKWRERWTTNKLSMISCLWEEQVYSALEVFDKTLDHWVESTFITSEKDFEGWRANLPIQDAQVLKIVEQYCRDSCVM